jgi:hypothetical protein
MKVKRKSNNERPDLNAIGICHVEYELYDAENNLIQPVSESDGGRFMA